MALNRAAKLAEKRELRTNDADALGKMGQERIKLSKESGDELGASAKERARGDGTAAAGAAGAAGGGRQQPDEL